MRRLLPLSAVAAVLFARGLPAQTMHTPRTRPVTQAELDRITRDAILIDTHDDVTSLTVKGYNIAAPNVKGQTDLPRMKGILGAEFFAVYVGAEYVNGNHSANRALAMIDTVRTDIVAAHPAEFVFATTADEIVQAHKDGKIAALMGIEGGHAIEDSQGCGARDESAGDDGGHFAYGGQDVLRRAGGLAGAADRVSFELPGDL